MAASGRTSGLVIQALRHLGRRHVDDSVVRSLQRRLTDDEKKQLVSDLSYAPAWIAVIHATNRRIATGLTYGFLHSTNERRT